MYRRLSYFSLNKHCKVLVSCSEDNIQTDSKTFPDPLPESSLNLQKPSGVFVPARISTWRQTDIQTDVRTFRDASSQLKTSIVKLFSRRFWVGGTVKLLFRDLWCKWSAVLVYWQLHDGETSVNDDILHQHGEVCDPLVLDGHLHLILIWMVLFSLVPGILIMVRHTFLRMFLLSMVW